MSYPILEGLILDSDYLYSGDLIIAAYGSLRVYNGHGNLTTHPIQEVVLNFVSSVSIDRKRQTIAVTQWSEKRGPGSLHVFMLDRDSFTHQQYDISVEPMAVAVTKTGDYIVAGHGLQKYNNKGREVWNNDLVHSANVLCVDHQNNILVNVDNSDVFIFNQYGDVLLALSSKLLSLKPSGICVADDDDDDGGGAIFVCDETSNSVLLFDKQYNYVRSLVRLDYTPHRIAIYQTINLAIFSRPVHIINVYKL